MAAVSCRDLTRTFAGGVVALDGLDLVVEDGELLAVVGPSGCGKSTLLRLLAGLETPTRGRIEIGGTRVDGLPPQARDVAMVFQDYALYPHKTVRGNLDFPLRMMKLDKDERARRIARTAELLGLEALLDRRPAALSGGQRQRAAMGRALVRDPRVFLMDEPLSNLDARLRTAIRTQIADLQRELGITMIYVTHDQTEAMTLGHRVALLRDGRLQQLATARELFAEPANVFAAAFVGSPPMNLLRARLERRGEDLACRCGEAELVLGADDVRPAWREAAGGEAVLGLRPEALRAADDPPAGRRLQLRVQAVEELGHERIVHLEPPPGAAAVDATGDGRDAGGGGGPLAARLPASGARPERGDALTFAVDTTAVRLFGPDGGAL